MLISFVIAAILVGLDQLTKYLAAEYLAPVGSCPFLPGVMELRYVRNDGAAFSLLANAAWGRFFLIAVTSLALAALAVWFVRTNPRSWWVRWCFILIFSGGLGNLIDRILHGSVVDFFATTFINFAVFNVADCFVCIGTALFVLYVLKQEMAAAKAHPETSKEPQ